MILYVFACRLTLENLQSEFGEINSSVKEVDQVLQSSPEEMQKQFLSFIKVTRDWQAAHNMLIIFFKLYFLGK